MKTELRAHLLPYVASQVGARVAWELRPQGGALPAVSLTMVSAPRDYTMQGRDRLTGYLVQVDAWAGTLSVRENLAAAIITALDEVGGGALKAAFIENQRDTFEVGQGPDAAGSSDFYRSSFDVRIWSNT